MTSFYIVPPRKTQLGDNGISISGTLGVITTNPGGAAITGVGALKLDTTYSPTWTGIHTFTQPIIFAGSQVINSTLISTTGQTAGDLFYYTGTSWSRLAAGSNNQILQSFGGGIGWTGGVNLLNVITGNLKIGSLTGVLKASSGVVSGNSGIGDLSNVVLNLPASGNFLKYNGTNWVNSPIPLSDHNIIIRFLNGYTPVQSGVDIEIALVPYEPSDGTTVLEYTITRIIFQVEVAGSTTSQITIERALLGQEFDNPMTLGNTIETLSLGSGVYTVSSTGPFFKIYSGERLRLNINSIGTGAQQWTVQVEGTAGNPYNGTNAGITSINSLAAQLQNMVVGSGGTDFNISSLIDTHTFNIPSASGTNRGLVTTGNQTFAGVKTFNNLSASTSTTSGAIIVNGGVGIGETLNVGGNVVVGNNLILNNPMPVQSGGTGITALGSANSLLAVNNTASALEYKNLIAGTGISINFNSSNITLDVTGSANTGNIGFNNDVIYNTLNNTIYISPSDQYVGYSYIAVPNDNDATVSALAIGNLVGSIQITSGTSISNSYTWTFNNDGTLSSPYYTFPNNDGLTGQALITDGAGNLFWGTVASTSSGGGISSLNGISYINYPVQNFAVGSAGTNFNIVSIGSTHTLNLPEAGLGASGIVTTGLQTFAGVKSFANNLIAQSDINVSGSSNLLSAVGVSSSLNVAGGFGVTGATILRSTLQVQGVTTLTNNTNASSSTSGSLVVTGGVGVSGALYVGSGANINSNNVSGVQSNSGLVFSGNSLTTGTGFYVASSSLTTGKLIDVVVSGNTATGIRTGINVSITGSNASTGVTTYGMFVNNTSTNAGNNIGLASYASGVTNNIPLRIGLNASRYINFFINSEGNGLTLSPTGNGTPFLALGGYSGVAGELRLLQSGGFGDPNYVALKAPVTVTNRYELIFPDSYPSSSGMALVGTGTTQVTLSWSSSGAGGIGGTINAGDQYKLAFYVNPNGSSVLDDAQALNYSTSGANLTINSTAASVVPLKLVGAVSQTADLLQVATSSGNIFNIDKDGISTFTNNLVVSSTATSTSSSTGALTVTGGLGVQGRVNIGTGLSVASTANFASSVEINTLRLLNVLTLNNGGTGLGTSGLPNQILGMNSSSSSLEYKTINVGFGITVAYVSNSITISTTSSGSGISSLNSLTSTEQTFAVGSAGSNFNIVSSGSIHTFNMPAAGVGSSGVVTTSEQSIAGNKSFIDVVVASGLGVSNSATFRSTVDVFGGLGVTGSTTLRSTLSVLGTASFATINQGTWNGSTIGLSYGGTGLGSTGTANQFLGMSNDSTGLEYKTFIAGSNVTILHSTNSITISTTLSGGGSGVVNTGLATQVAYYAVGGTSVSGTSNLTVGSSGVGISFVTQSTSSTSGALVVAGGVGVSGNVRIGSGLGVSGTLNFVSGTFGNVGSSTFALNFLSSGNSPISLNVLSDNSLSFEGSSGQLLAISNNLSTGYIYSINNISGLPLFRANANGTVSMGEYSGNIGVGTSNPQFKFHVIGDTNVTGGFGVSGLASIAGGLGVTGYTNLSSTLIVQGNTGIVGGLGVTGSSLFRSSVIVQSGGLGVTGGIVITQGGLGVTGATVLRSTLSVLGTASFATINQGTWNGSVIGLNYGGTGLGSSGTANQFLGMSNDSTSLEYKTLIAGSNVTILNSTNSITISAVSGGGAGTVNTGLATQVAYYAVGGTSVSGTANLTVSSSGVGVSFVTQSTSSSTGALVVLGGLGVSGNLNVGTGLTVLGTVHLASNTNSTSSTTGALIVTGGIGVSGRIWSGSGISSQGGGTFTGALSASSLTLSSALSISNGGTGLGTSGIANQILGMNIGSTSFEYKTLIAGSNISIVHGSGTVTLNAIGTGISSLNGLANTTQSFATGYSGTDFNIVSIGSTHTFNIPVAGSGSSGIITTSSQTIAGAKVFTGGIIVQSSGLGVTGGIVVTQGGLGVTGATILNGSLTVATSTILNSTLDVAGNTNVASDVNIGGATNISGLGVSNNINITGGLGISGAALFRSSVIVHAGGLGVTGGIVITQGGLGVTGSTTLRSTLSVLGTASFATINQGTWNGSTIGLPYGGTGLGSSGTANQFLGMSNDSASLEYKTLIAGSNVTILNSTNSITISATSGSGSGIVNSGLITQVAYYAVGGTSVSGTSNLTVGSSGVGISFNTQSTSSSTGALIVLGGLGVSGNINVGTGLTVLAAVHAASNVNSTSSTSGALIVTGGIGASGRIWAGSGISSQGGGTFTGALSASSLTLSSALSLSSGGTGLGSSGVANQILGMNNASSALEYKTLTAGSNISIVHGSGTVTLNVVGAGISSLNGLTNTTQVFATGYSGTDFNIVSIGSTHTFNIPVAGSGSSGIITTGAQTIAGAKIFTGSTIIGSTLDVASGFGVTGAAVFRSTVQSFGIVSIGNTTNSTSSTSGALQIVGGLGVSGNVYIGTGLSVAGSATFRSGTSSTGTAPIYLTSGINLTTPESGALEFDGTYIYFTPSSVRKQISNIALSGSAPSGASAGDFWWDATNGVLKIYYDSYWVETTGSDIYTAISNQVLSINDTTNSTSSTSGALIVAGGIGVSGNVNIGSGLGISGLATLTYTSEALTTKTSATGTVNHDLSTGSIFYHSSISNNFTANITNVPATNDRAIGVTLVLSQGGTAYMATALQIDGNAQTIKWVNNTVPSGLANKVDVVGFSLIRTGSSWTVLGQYSTYG